MKKKVQIFIYICFTLVLSITMLSNVKADEGIFSPDLELVPYYNDTELGYEATLTGSSITTTLYHDFPNIATSLGTGQVTLNVGTTHQVTLIGITGEITVYNIIPTNGIAKIDNIVIPGVPFDFNKNNYYYEVDVENKMTTFEPNIETEEGIVSSISNQTLKVGNNKIEITTSKVGLDSVTYTFVLNRAFEKKVGEFTKTFDYIQGKPYHIFEAPYTTDYTLEVWGAEGAGNDLTSQIGTSGKGGYAKGTVHLEAGEKLYIYIGGRGGICYGKPCSVEGGYNGGGSGITYTSDPSDTAASGGGGTDMRIFKNEPDDNDLIWNSTTGLYSRIIVAGGGGAGGMDCETAGSGGGESGIQITNTARVANQSSGWAFGYGFGASNATVSYISARYGGQGAGGGWYGGYSGSSWWGAGGGSGYVYTATSYKPAGYDVDSKYQLTNTQLIAGNKNIPNTTGTGTMTGKRGNGYARITYVSTEEPDQLLSITTDKRELNFSADTTDYNIELGVDEKEITISAELLRHEGHITGTGTFQVPSGITTFPVIFTNTDGSVKPYNIIVTRYASDTAELAGFKVNGVSYETIAGETEYTITVPTNTSIINLELIKKYPGQIVTSPVIYQFTGDELTQSITVTPETDSFNDTYTFTFVREKTTKLKNLTVDEVALNIPFDPNIYDYSLEITDGLRALTVNAQAWFSEAKVVIPETRYIEKTVTEIPITVTLENCSTSIYTIHLNRIPAITETTEFEFPYTGDYDTFIAPATGRYLLEVWGAEGAGKDLINTIGVAGAGGYSKGIVNLSEGQRLYVYVGGRGSICYGRPCSVAGGFNGGGSGITKTSSYSDAAASGGGGTDIRLYSGAWNSDAGLKSRIIVAGGGGAGGMDVEPAGAGGGTSGIQTYNKGKVANQTSGWKFGEGFSATNETLNYVSTSYGGQGAGGGWYGGYTGSSWWGAGGGSGFVFNQASKVNTPTGYNVSDAFLLTDAVTIAGTEIIPTHDGEHTMTGNRGNGYAKITLLPNNIADTYLKTLTLNDDTIDIDFSPWTTEYIVNLSSDVDTVKIAATPMDSNALVSGLETFSLEPGIETTKEVVVSLDGQSKTYTLKITREASSDSTPDTILLHNPMKYLCRTGLCEYTFNAEVTSYDIYLPHQTREISLEAVLKSEYQNVVYKKKVNDSFVIVTDPTFELDLENTFQVDVYSESGVPKTYTYNISLDEDGNNNLGSLTLTNPDIPINFHPNTYEYYLTVTSEVTSYTVNATPQATGASIKSITGNEELNEGLNDCIITVKGKNGSERNYILHVFQEPSSNNLLSTLKVYDQDNNEITLSPAFDKMFNNYTATVDASVTSVDIRTTITKGTVSNDGVHGLNTGKNEIAVSVTPERGSINVYNITIFKEKNKNSDLSNLVVKNGETIYPITPSPFSNATKEYTITIPKNVNSVEVIATPEETETTTVNIVGNTNLVNKSNTITVTSIAEDKSSQKFTIIVEKETSNNNDLTSITIDGEPLEGFSANNTTYSLNVESNVKQIDVGAILSDISATVTGTGIYALAKGENTITITVTSEKGENKPYILTVTRQSSDDTRLLRVENSQGKTPTEGTENDAYDYLINVQYDVSEITLKGIPYDEASTVSGNGTFSLSTGVNEFTLQVKSELGRTQNYKVHVVRDESENDDLEFLYVEEGGLTPNFSETTIFYDVKVPNEIDSLDKLHIDAILEDKNAAYELIYKDTDHSLKDTKDTEDEVISKEVVVRVYAEKYKTSKEKYKDYTIRVTRQPVITSNLNLLTLTTSPTELTGFSENTTNYELTIEHNVENLTVSATAADENMRVFGTGTYPMKVGKNLISVFVIDNDSNEKSYQIVVTRKKSNDATLSSVSIKGHVISPKFAKETVNYTLTTSNNELDFLNITPTQKDSTYKVTGNENFTTGENTVSIEVTAPDGETKNTYYFIVTKTGSKNNNLSFLEVENQTLSPTFHKGVTFYAVEVGNNVNSIVINARAEDENAQSVTGTGLKTIVTGENYFDITVTSEAGTQKIYKILVTKEASDNNYLAKLIPSEGTLIQKDTDIETFEKTITKYKMTVPYTTEEISFSGETEDKNANVVGLNAHSLEYGVNNIEISVTSESGILKVYNIEVTREPCVSPYLKSLSLEEYDLDSEFNKEILEYYVDVNNEISSYSLLKLSFEKEDANATVRITDGDSLVCDETCSNFNFNVGMNEVHIEVTASDNVTTKEYILYVNRAMSTNNYLDSLTVSEGALDEEFTPEDLIYYVEVKRNVESITINATTQDSSARITEGVGTHTLDFGENLIQVKVKSSIGITRTYKVYVNRKKDDNNKLAQLRVMNKLTNIALTPEFDANTTSYTINANSDIEYVTINATPASEYSKGVEGIGTKALKAGENVFIITVTSEDDSTKDYTITITKDVSTNNYLEKLIPSSGTLKPTFTKETTSYELELDQDVENLSFDAKAESPLATVSGETSMGVPEGESTRTISVKAEDNTIKNYVVKIKKASAAEARLESLTLQGYEFEFDPNTFTYNISVSKSKKTLTEEEITAIAMDAENATVNKIGDIDLVDGMVNVYTIEVIAKDGVTSQPYTLNITRDSETYSLMSDVYDINRNDTEDYVIGILPSTADDAFKGNFTNEITMLHVYKEETELEDGKLVATEMVIKLESADYVYDTARIIVRGDLTKDGKVDITDQVKLINYVGKAITFNRNEMLAGDLTFDGRVDITDQVKLINYVGKAITSINPVKISE